MAEAAVEVVPEAEAGATVGLEVRVIPKTAPRVGSHSPLKDPHLGGG